MTSAWPAGLYLGEAAATIGEVIMTTPELAAAEVTVPSTALASVPAGGRVLGQVVMSSPAGETVSSQTFVARVR